METELLQWRRLVIAGAQLVVSGVGLGVIEKLMKWLARSHSRAES